jgi:transcriptional antiterminator RfaH
MEGWYVAKTNRGKNSTAVANLERWGVETFCPMIRYSDRPHSTMEQLFPSYLFCRFDPDSYLAPIVRWSPGLAYLLGADDGLACLSDEFINHLKDKISWWNDGGYKIDFQEGERVTVQHGPFAGLEGLFQRYIPARQRCEILVEVVGRVVRAELPEHALRYTRSRSPYMGAFRLPPTVQRKIDLPN